VFNISLHCNFIHSFIVNESNKYKLYAQAPSFFRGGDLFFIIQLFGLAAEGPQLRIGEIGKFGLDEF
jgi:hypothetical protein